MRNFGLVLSCSRRYEQAERQLRKVLEMEAGFSWAHAYLGSVYVAQGRYTDALAEYEAEEEHQQGFNPQLDAWRGIAYAKMGKTDEAREVLATLLEHAERGYVPRTFLASLHFALGENDPGFRWLHKGYEEHDSMLIEVGTDPAFDEVRSDPRFVALLRNIGLEERED
jgi:tetratricopeptide (TPR) repeat protein